MREEMQRREAARREQQRTTEADEDAVCEVSEGNLILLRAEPNPEASRPVQKKQSSLYRPFLSYTVPSDAGKR